MSKWLEELTEGVEVVAYYHSGRGAGSRDRETVQKISASWIWTDKNKYRRTDGMRVGVRSPAESYISELWAAHETRERARVLRYRTKDRISGATLDQLDRIMAILDEKPEVGE